MTKDVAIVIIACENHPNANELKLVASRAIQTTRYSPAKGLKSLGTIYSIFVASLDLFNKNV